MCIRVSIVERGIWSPNVPGTYGEWRSEFPGIWVRHATQSYCWFTAEFDQIRTDKSTDVLPRPSTAKLRMNHIHTGPAFAISFLVWVLISAGWLKYHTKRPK